MVMMTEPALSSVGVLAGADDSEALGAAVVGQPLLLRIGKTEQAVGRVIAFFPKSRKHRLRLGEREKNVRLEDVNFEWVEASRHDVENSNGALPQLELAIRRDAVGRRLEIYHPVRQKCYQATILSYVEDCHQHTLQLEPQGKVHLVDLGEQVWRFTDLMGTPTFSPLPLNHGQLHQHSLATSKYMGVRRFTESTWKAYDSSDVYIGCFASEKDAALAYDVYARKRSSPVNFGDRRISRRGIKLLEVPEPAEEDSEDIPSLDTEDTESIPVDPVQLDVVNNRTMHESIITEAESLPDRPESVVFRRISVDDDDDDDDEDLHKSVPEVNDDDDTDEEIAPRKGSPKRRGLASGVKKTAVQDDDPTEFAPQKSIGKQGRHSVAQKKGRNHCKPLVSAPKLSFKVEDKEEDSDDEEFEFHGDEDEESYRSNDNSYSGTDGEEEMLPRRTARARGKMKSKSLENIFDSSDEEDEEEHKRIAKQMKKKGAKRALMELVDFNTPPLHEDRKRKKKKKKAKLERKRPIYPVGTRFLKKFPGHGTFEGRITKCDGNYFHVYYSEDDDQEEFSYREMDNHRVIWVPGEKVAGEAQIKTSKKINKRRKAIEE